MLAQWTAVIVGQMHLNRITAKELSAEVGWHPKYLSAVLNGRKSPAGAEEKLCSAMEKLITQRRTESLPATKM